jgi:hypothetical protein
MLGLDNPMQAPAFGCNNQDPFLDSEYWIKGIKFAIKQLNESNWALNGME